MIINKKYQIIGKWCVNLRNKKRNKRNWGKEKELKRDKVGNKIEIKISNKTVKEN